MTPKQFEKRYRNVELLFRDYYKYTFTFVGEVDGKQIIASFGGDPDSIYRSSITNDEIRKLGSLKNWRSVSMYDENDELFFWMDEEI